MGNGVFFPINFVTPDKLNVGMEAAALGSNYLDAEQMTGIKEEELPEVFADRGGLLELVEDAAQGGKGNIYRLEHRRHFLEAVDALWPPSTASSSAEVYVGLQSAQAPFDQGSNCHAGGYYYAASGTKGGGRGQTSLVIPDQLDKVAEKELHQRIGELTKAHLDTIAARARREIERGTSPDPWLDLLFSTYIQGPLQLRDYAKDLAMAIGEGIFERVDAMVPAAKQMDSQKLWMALEDAIDSNALNEIMEIVILLATTGNETDAEKLATHPNPGVRYDFYFCLLHIRQISPQAFLSFWGEIESHLSPVGITDGFNDLRPLEIWKLFAKAGVEDALTRLYHHTQSSIAEVRLRAYNNLARVLLDEHTIPTPSLDDIAVEVLRFPIENDLGIWAPIFDVLASAEALVQRAEGGSEEAREALRTLARDKLLHWPNPAERRRVQTILAKLDSLD